VSERRTTLPDAPGSEALLYNDARPPLIEPPCRIDSPFECGPVVARPVVQRMVVCRQVMIVRRDRDDISERPVALPGINRVITPHKYRFRSPIRRMTGSSSRYPMG
jgi:hypothetical protein